MYGIEDNDKHYNNLMIDKQKDYLAAHDYNSMSANISPLKYLAEVYNRIEAMEDVAKKDKLIPIFITITAPSAYHPASKRFNGETVHATSLYLSTVWARLLRSNVFKRMKDNHHDKHYFRTYEPMKSGVPHIHALLYIDRRYLLDIKKAFILLMQKEQIKQYKFIFQFKSMGYNSNHAGATAYIIKYINKSLADTKNGNLSDVAHWYMKNNIRRFLTSRSLVPLFVTRKINYLDDFKKIKKVDYDYKRGKLVVSFLRTYIEYHYFDIEDLEYKSKLLWTKPIRVDPGKRKLLKWFDKPTKTIKIPVLTDGKLTHYYVNGNFLDINAPKLSYDEYSDIELYRYIKEMDSLDIDDLNLVRYAIFKEEAIKRGLIDDVPCKISDYSVEFNIHLDIHLE